jgi:O-antigen/teichoic acid export membrane protein
MTQSSLRQLASDSLLNFSRQAVNIIFGLLTSIIVARGLGLENRGYYALALLLPLTLQSLLNSGLQISIVYHVARDAEQRTLVINRVVLLSSAVCVVSIAIGLLMISLGHEVLFPDVPLSYLLAGILLAPLNIYFINIIAIFRGLEDFRTSNFVEIIPQAITFVMTIVLIWVFPFGVVGAVIAIIIAKFAAIGLGTYKLKQRRPVAFSIPNKDDIAYMNQVIRYSLKAQIGFVAALVNYRVDVYILNLFYGPAVIGLYDLAVTLVERLWTLSYAISAVLLPRIAALKSDDRQRNFTTATLTRYTSWLLIGSALGAFVLVDWLIPLLYGEAFRDSATVLKVLLIGIVSMGIAHIIANDLAGRGLPMLNSNHAILAAAINVAINLYLIPEYGLIGAAIATSISYTAMLLAKIIVFLQITRIRVYDLFLPSAFDARILRSLLRQARRH